MFVYVKYEDGVRIGGNLTLLKETISVDRIGNFDMNNINFERKYKIKRHDGNYYNGIIGTIQGKAICAESKEEIEKKIRDEIVEFSPLTLCDTATDFETDTSELDRPHNSKGDANLKEKIEKKFLKINENKNDETDETSDKNRTYGKDKKENTCEKENKTITKNRTEKTDTKRKCTLNVKKAKELLKQYKHNKQRYSSQSKSVDSECGENGKSPVHKQSKSQLAYTITVLTEENKRLRRDNERLLRLRSVNEDLSKMDKMMKDLTINLQSASLKTESLNHQIDKLQQKVQAISYNCTIEPEQGSSAMTLNVDPSTSGHNLVPQNYNPESSPKDFPDTSVVIKTVYAHQLEHESNHAADKVKSSDDHQSITVHKPIKEKTVDLGGPEPCEVIASCLSLSNHTSASKLICQMMSLLFSKEELATSSLTGTRKFHFDKGVAAKKKLDTVKIAAMKAYVKKKFPKEKDFDNIFRKTVKKKCNNALSRNKRPNNEGETNK